MTIRNNGKRPTLPALAAASVLALVWLAVAGDARAVQLDLSCVDAGNALLSGDPQAQLVVVSEAVGSTGMLANLACFVEDRRCHCLRDVTESDSFRSDEWAKAVADVLARCFASEPGRSLSGIALEASLDVCP